MWYDSGNSKEEETATFRRLVDPLNQILMLWTLTRSISPQEKELSTLETKSASYATRRDAIRPNTEDTLEREEEGEPQGITPLGERLQKPLGRSKLTWRLPTS